MQNIIFGIEWQPDVNVALAVAIGMLCAGAALYLMCALYLAGQSIVMRED